MADKIFFKIGSVDLSQYVDIQNFDLQQVNIFDEWEDGQWKKHRWLIRTEISGKVVLGFKTQAEYEAFLAAFAAQEQSDTWNEKYYTVQAYVNNACQPYGTKKFTAFLTLAGSGKWDTLNGRLWITQEIDVMEV